MIIVRKLLSFLFIATISNSFATITVDTFNVDFGKTCSKNFPLTFSGIRTNLDVHNAIKKIEPEIHAKNVESVTILIFDITTNDNQAISKLLEYFTKCLNEDIDKISGKYLQGSDNNIQILIDNFNLTIQQKENQKELDIEKKAEKQQLYEYYDDKQPSDNSDEEE